MPLSTAFIRDESSSSFNAHAVLTFDWCTQVETETMCSRKNVGEMDNDDIYVVNTAIMFRQSLDINGIAYKDGHNCNVFSSPSKPMHMVNNTSVG